MERLTDILMDILIDRLNFWFTNRLMDRLLDKLTDILMVRLVDISMNRLMDKLINQLIISDKQKEEKIDKNYHL